MSCLDEISLILRTTLQLPRMQLDEHTLLLGSVPELDSMSVASVIAAMESQFGIQVEDDEIGARHFASVGSLVAFIQAKLAE